MTTSLLHCYAAFPYCCAPQGAPCSTGHHRHVTVYVEVHGTDDDVAVDYVGCEDVVDIGDAWRGARRGWCQGPVCHETGLDLCLYFSRII